MEYIQGENLTQKFESCGHYFSLKTVLMVLMELMRLTKEFYTSTGLGNNYLTIYKYKYKYCIQFSLLNYKKKKKFFFFFIIFFNLINVVIKQSNFMVDFKNKIYLIVFGFVT